MSTAIREYCEAIDRLSHENRQRLPVIEWLVSDEGRGTGRTTLLAIALGRKAMASGREVELFDHAGTSAAKMGMERVAAGMFAGSATVGKGTIRMNRVPTLLPIDGVLYTDEGVRSLKEDLRTVAATLVRLGTPVHELVSAVRECLASEVLET